MATKYSDVFIPGGFPTITYNPRTVLKLEDKMREARNNICKLVVVSGQTKAGKTVLVNRIFSRDETIWVDGGSVQNEEEFWSYLLDNLNITTDIEVSNINGSEALVCSGVKATTGIPFFNITPQANFQISENIHKNFSYGRKNTPKVVVINYLRNNMIPIVIDDFHYIEKNIQAQIVRSFKALIMHGLPLVLIAIPNRKYDAVKVEREMTGRIEQITIPQWSNDELCNIANNGFKSLNILLSHEIIEKMAREAFGSPHLMQEFCKSLCKLKNVLNEQEKELEINVTQEDLNSIFSDIAQNTGRPMFERLARGPRQRSDRKERLLKKGNYTDIYGVVMEALKNLQPGMERIPYEDLRTSMKEILQEAIPQRHETTRVLDYITQISYDDSASTPVIEWNKEDGIINITDPFFAFFLKWAHEN